MARPKGSGGRSSYDKYRKFTRKSRARRVGKTYQSRDSGGKFMKKSSGAAFSKGVRRRGRKGIFSR